MSRAPASGRVGSPGPSRFSTATPTPSRCTSVIFNDLPRTSTLRSRPRRIRSALCRGAQIGSDPAAILNEFSRVDLRTRRRSRPLGPSRARTRSGRPIGRDERVGRNRLLEPVDRQHPPGGRAWRDSRSRAAGRWRRPGRPGSPAHWPGRSPRRSDSLCAWRMSQPSPIASSPPDRSLLIGRSMVRATVK